LIFSLELLVLLLEVDGLDQEAVDLAFGFAERFGGSVRLIWASVLHEGGLDLQDLGIDRVGVRCVAGGLGRRPPSSVWMLTSMRAAWRPFFRTHVHP
jgi:hypothetical protein